MAVWIMNKGEVFGEVYCQCSECGWADWQSTYWWSNYANFCPQCGTRMESVDAEDGE